MTSTYKSLDRIQILNISSPFILFHLYKTIYYYIKEPKQAKRESTLKNFIEKSHNENKRNRI